MEDNEEVKKDMEQGSAESEPNVEKSEEKKEEKTYSRDEVNKIVNAEKNRALEEYKAQIEAQKTEADKLAKMDEDQKRAYELEQWKKRAEQAEKKNSISELKNETLKQAEAKGISLALIETINFEYETAESISSKLDMFEKAVKKEREIAISEYSKEEPLQTGDYRGTQKSENEMTYEELCNLPKYKK